jgi:DNA primase
MSSSTEEIKNRLDIAEFIGSYVRLQKAGSTFKACCPFHSEKTPSFVVSPARQMWHCFGCGKGGDAFSFLMEIEGHDFPEALKILADRTGVVLPEHNQKAQGEKTRLLEIMEAATVFFQQKLREGAEASTYLEKRGLAKETIEEFRVGFAPNDWQALTKALGAKGFSGPELEKVGLAIAHQPNAQTQSGAVRYYDRFRGRIMFPIFDYQGHVIAFGGRLFEASGETPRDKEAKYINTPETPLYYKSRVLYGMHKAKAAIAREGSCIIVEGYMDALMAYQAGTHHVVASSGTALTVDQVQLIKRLTTTVFAAFDMDAAGQAAAERGIELLLKEGIDVKVIKLTGVKDPADAVQKDPELWRHAVVTARPLIQFYIDIAVSRHNPATPEGKREFERVVTPRVALLSSELERAHWVAEISTLLRVSEQAIWTTLAKQRSSRVETRPSEVLNKAVKSKNRKDLLEERILGMLIRNPEFFEKPGIVIQEAFFSEEHVGVLSAIRSNDVKDELKETIARLALEAELFLEGAAHTESEFMSCFMELEKEHVRERMKSLTFAIKHAELSDPERVSSLLEEFQNISLQLRSLEQGVRPQSH